MEEISCSTPSQWLSRHTGLLPSQYNASASHHIVQGIMLSLRSKKRFSCTMLTEREATSSRAMMTLISQLCSTILHRKEALPLVECLLDCKFHSSDLSPSFLEKLTQLQKGASVLSYRAKVSLWSCYLPSYRQHLLDLMDNLQSEKSTDSKLEEKRIESLLHSSDLPRACLERVQLFLYAEEFLRTYWTSNPVTMKSLDKFIEVFNRMLFHQYNSSMGIRPSNCPAFTKIIK